MSNEIVKAAKEQYKNVGYNKEDDGDMSLYVNGALFGASLKEQQYNDAIEALKVCYRSLCTYGSHPIIEKHVNNVLSKPD